MKLGVFWAVCLAINLSWSANAQLLSNSSAVAPPPVQDGLNGQCASRLIKARLMPPAFLSESLGLNYDRMTQRDLAPPSTFLRSGFHEMATVRRFETKEFATEVTEIEIRPGIAMENILKMDPLLFPPIKDLNGKPISLENPYPSDFSQAAEINTIYLQGLSESKQRLFELFLLIQTNLALVHTYYDHIATYVAFANKQYDRRGWSPEMLKSLANAAVFYYEQSTYIALFAKHEGREELAGTLRLIRAPYKKLVTKWLRSGKEDVMFERGKLFNERFGKIKGGDCAGINCWKYPDHRLGFAIPEHLDATFDKIPRHGETFKKIPKLMMEDSQNVTLPRPAVLTLVDTGIDQKNGPYEIWAGEGEIIEPGTLAIDKKFNNDGFAEILAQMMVQVIDPAVSSSIPPESRYFYTYNDRPMVYEMLGFHKLEDKPYKQEFNDKSGRMEDWWLMGASVKDLSDMAKGLYQRRRYLDQQRLTQIREMVQSRTHD